MVAVSVEQGLDLAVEAGVHWLRFLALEWDRIEPERTEPPTYHWDVVDETSLRAAAERGLEVIALVQFTPEWAQAVPGSFCGPVRSGALPDMARFLQAAVARYGAPPYGIRYWELGNEPDVDPTQVPSRSIFGCWGDRTDDYFGGRAYAEMLRAAYPAVKAQDPDAQVLLGGLLLDRPFGGPDNNPRFLEGVLEGGGGPYFDVLSFHAYSYYDPATGETGNPAWPGEPTVLPAKVAFVRDILDRYGLGARPLMNTESALLCGEPSLGCLEAQARHVTRSYAEALALGLAAQIHYAWINEQWRYTGLLLPDLTPKPAYHAYRTATSLLAGARYRGEAVGYPAGMAGYSFQMAGSAAVVDVVWSRDGQPFQFPLPAGAQARDLNGEPIAAANAVIASSAPLYVLRID